ncbi:hypothetical protein ANN_24657 [Periplaneta americana]|uniref:Uncharacterized protein n=1 Tax=Periplaneta americana TaxID=6978 RepID=A0ABQ8S3W5_PERAM|nr:hypothetical protein ANN_24657 [Periplaneta americana]
MKTHKFLLCALSLTCLRDKISHTKPVHVQNGPLPPQYSPNNNVQQSDIPSGLLLMEYHYTHVQSELSVPPVFVVLWLTLCPLKLHIVNEKVLNVMRPVERKDVFFAAEKRFEQWAKEPTSRRAVQPVREVVPSDLSEDQEGTDSRRNVAVQGLRERGRQQGAHRSTERGEEATENLETAEQRIKFLEDENKLLRREKENGEEREEKKKHGAASVIIGDSIIRHVGIYNRSWRQSVTLGLE